MSYGPPGEQQPGNADELRGPTVLRMILGSQMRRLREAAGVTPDQAAWELRAARSKISRMEHGRVRCTDRDVADVRTLYGITDEKLRARMLASAQDANAPAAHQRAVPGRSPGHRPLHGGNERYEHRGSRPRP